MAFREYGHQPFRNNGRVSVLVLKVSLPEAQCTNMPADKNDIKRGNSSSIVIPENLRITTTELDNSMAAKVPTVDATIVARTDRKEIKQGIVN
jgi:hypothetical protein